MHRINGSPKVSSPGSRCRKRSSSLFALDDLSFPSPPLSPSVSINFTKKRPASGEIPIIFDFLTTNTPPSEEQISKTRTESLNLPCIPALARFSPMSAFFPMSNSSETLNTISTQAFGTARPGSYCSQAGEQGYRDSRAFSDFSAVSSPLNAEFDIPSPTNHSYPGIASDTTQDFIASSASTPAVQVLDYDMGQKKLGDVSHFSISAYLASPSIYGDAPRLSQTSLSSEPSLGPTIIQEGGDAQSDHLDEESLLNQGDQVLLVPANNKFLSALNSSDSESEDKTPTQATFKKRHTIGPITPHSGTSSSNASVKNISTLSSLVTSSLSLSTMDFSSRTGSSLLTPTTQEFDDKTPTQSTFNKQPKIVKPPYRSSSLEDQHHTIPVNLEIQAIRPSSSVSKAESESTVDRYPGLEQRTRPVMMRTSDEAPKSETVEESIVNEKPYLPSPNPSLSVLSVPCLKHAQWLRETVVELWIDQEGFRAIRPQFFLASISNAPLPNTPGDRFYPEEHDPLHTTVAEFLPVSRAAHYFHHAALDRAPTLNRITTGGDEKKDFITRAATLGLRENGVFFVHGTEDHRVDSGERPGAPGGRVIRLNWRFEYFVSSRRPDGLTAHKGEKVFTPLSFSCTPALLNPSRANKVKVLHIMKKTLLPNLVAQKLEPPDLPALHTRASNSSLASLISMSMSESRTSISSQKSSKGIFSKSSRSRRGSVSEQGAPPSSAFVPPKLKSPQRSLFPNTRHRRGSHSETYPEDFMRRRYGDKQRAKHERSRSASSFGRGAEGGASEGNPVLNNTQLIGPIIPHGELLKMLDSEGVENATRRPNSVRIEVINNVQMTTLPAAPRHKNDL